MTTAEVRAAARAAAKAHRERLFDEWGEHLDPEFGRGIEAGFIVAAERIAEAQRDTADAMAAAPELTAGGISWADGMYAAAEIARNGGLTND